MLNNLSTYLAPFLVFGLVVFVHELGHFLAAKMCGVYAPVFSLGWGSRLFGIRRGETDYRVSWFPIGGFVRMATREDDSMAGIEGGRDRGDIAEPPQTPPTPSALWDENAMAPFGPRPVPEDRWVESKSTAARVFILSAGVIMNILLTILVSGSVGYVYGKAYRPAIVDSLVRGDPADIAGIKSGDVIVAVNNQPVQSWDDAVDKIAPVTTGTLTLEVQRGPERIVRTLTPALTDGIDPVTGAKRKVGKVGIWVKNTLVRTPMSVGEAVTFGFRATWSMATKVGDVLRGLVSGEVSATNLGGPISIARGSVQAARDGGEFLWSLIAFISVNIAILNLVPIPVLDGGQILLVLAERVNGRPFSANVREGFAKIGILIVLALFVLVMFNDIKSWLFS